MSLRKAFGMLAAIAAISSVNVQAGTTAGINSNTNKEITLAKKVSSMPEFVKNKFGGFGNNYGGIIRKPVGNQRQYRKWMRQCPHMKRSKKFRGKN